MGHYRTRVAEGACMGGRAGMGVFKVEGVPSLPHPWEGSIL